MRRVLSSEIWVLVLSNLYLFKRKTEGIINFNPKINLEFNYNSFIFESHFLQVAYASQKIMNVLTPYWIDHFGHGSVTCESEHVWTSFVCHVRLVTSASAEGYWTKDCINAKKRHIPENV